MYPKKTGRKPYNHKLIQRRIREVWCRLHGYEGAEEKGKITLEEWLKTQPEEVRKEYEAWQKK